MQFLVIGEDYRDPEAINRRTSARDQHLKTIAGLAAEGRVLYAAAILDESEKMVGSTLICDFPSREDLDQWLEQEVYVQEKVWETVRVERCQVGPMFLTK